MSKFALAIVFLFLSALCTCWTNYPACAGEEYRERNYYVLFSQSGQRSLGDVAVDKEIEVFGSEGSAFQALPEEVKIISGCLLFKTESAGFKFDLKNVQILAGKYSEIMAATSSKTVNSACLAVLSGEAQINCGGRWYGIEPGETVYLNFAADGNLRLEKKNLCPPASLVFGQENAGAPVRVVAADDSAFMIRHNEIRISRGSLLLDLPPGVKVTTPGGTFSTRDHGLCTVRMFDNTLCLEKCSGAEPFDYSVQGCHFAIAPGREAILKRGLPEPQILPADKVARRRLMAHYDGQLTLVTADFELCSLIKASPPLLSLSRHPFTWAETKISEELIKSAAILQVVGSKYGNYTYQVQSLAVGNFGAFRNNIASVLPVSR